MLLRAARDSAVTQIYLNSEVWKCSFMLVISFNKNCIVLSLYILYCSICCYGQWCQVSVWFFWETRQNSGFSFLLLCLCSWPLQCCLFTTIQNFFPNRKALPSPVPPWPESLKQRSNGWIPPLARCFQNQGEAWRNRWDWPRAEKREVFGRGATKARRCQSMSNLGRALTEGRAAGCTASLPWRQPKSCLGRFRNVSGLGQLLVHVIYFCRD